MVRAKFRVQSIETFSAGSEGPVRIKFMAVSAEGVEENRRYHKYTPSGEIAITVDNPPAAAFFTVGKYVYVDFSEAE
jgi:hypothetical protein